MAKSTQIERNYWPHAIVTMILLAIIACIWTVKIALNNPVEMDSYYLEKYQQVDYNINEILAKQEAFDKAYAVEHQSLKFSLDAKNSVEIVLHQKDNPTAFIDNAKIKLLISRPETNAFNQEFVLQSLGNGRYKAEGIEVNKPGRWQILSRISVGDTEGYNKYEVFAN